MERTGAWVLELVSSSYPLCGGQKCPPFFLTCMAFGVYYVHGVSRFDQPGNYGTASTSLHGRSLFQRKQKAKRSMKELPLSKGRVAFVSDEDFDRVSKYQWCVNGSGYASAYIDGEQVFLHRFLMGAKKGEEVDHIDQNRFNCQRENMRLCTHGQNIANDGPKANNKLGIKGVDKRSNGRFRVTIRYNYKKIFIGNFITLKEAGLAYNEASKKYFGEFGFQNDVSAL